MAGVVKSEGLAGPMKIAPVTLNGLNTGRAFLVWTNRRTDSFHYEPGQFVIHVDVEIWRTVLPELDSVMIEIPPAWVSDLPVWRPVSTSTTNIEWRIFPRGEPRNFSERIVVYAVSAGEVIDRFDKPVTIKIKAFSQFDPVRHIFANPNTVHAWGVISPRREVFDRTYERSVFTDRFFRGLYARIVFLGGSAHSSAGGICTGLARAALERSINQGCPEPKLDEILVWHGRQLTDRALWSAAPWFFVSQANRAFAAFKREVLSDGVTRRCFDIGVPSPWRRDIFSALQRQGHTVVPYAFTQSSTDRAKVYVYDPNDPEKSRRDGTVLDFLLSENRYSYESLVGGVDERSRIIPVHQDAYRRGRAALLASMADAVLRIGMAVGEVLPSPRLRDVKSRLLNAKTARG